MARPPPPDTFRMDKRNSTLYRKHDSGTGDKWNGHDSSNGCENYIKNAFADVIYRAVLWQRFNKLMGVKMLQRDPVENLFIQRGEF